MKTSKQYSVLIAGIMCLLCLFFLSFLCPPPVFSAAPTAAYLQTISGNLYAPGRIAVGANGNIYVADPRQDKVQVYASDGYSKYAVVNFQGTPLGIAVDGSNNLYISDLRSKSVMVFDSNWNFIRKLGSGDNEFTLPGDIAISNSAGKIYVTDSQSHQVKIYRTSDGAWENTFGGYDTTAPGKFNFPTGIAVDDANSEVLVADEGSSSAGRLQRFQLDGAYKAGSGFSIKPFPQGITVDAAGRIYVADIYEGSVYVYDTAGTQLSTIGSWGRSGGQLSNPMDVVFDNYGNLLITSSNNAQVVMYTIDGSPPPPPCDTTPPSSEYSVSAAVGQNGWYKSNISIGLTATDSGENCPGGVSKIEYSFNAATWSEFTSLIDVATEGMIPFYYRATDVYGNVESTKTATLKIDKTPPTLSAFISPPPNANNWNNTDATVSFTASDDVSGLATVPSNATLTNEGSWVVTGTAADNAGNTITNSYPVQIDKIPPTITITSPSDNAVSGASIKLEYTVQDNLTAASKIKIEGDASGTVYTQEGTYIKTIKATDEAGWTTTKTITFTFIPNTGITTVKTSEPVYSYIAPKPKEAKEKAEAKKEEVKEKAGTASITIISPKEGLLTKDDVRLEYTVEGAEKIEGDASGTVYTKEDKYTKTITAIDKDGGRTTKKITFTIDKTPPEAEISYDIYNMDIKVSGTDNVSKDVIITKAETGFSYTLTDEAGNTLIILFEKMDKGANKLEAGIGILIYNGIGIIPNENAISITVNIDKKTGAVKNMTQTFRSKNMWKIVLDYDKKKNTTKVTTGDDKDIKAKDKKKDKTASSSGMNIIKFKTKAGELSYGY